MLESKREETERKQDVLESKHEETERKPEESERKHEETESKREETESKREESGSKHGETESKRTIILGVSSINLTENLVVLPFKEPFLKPKNRFFRGIEGDFVLYLYILKTK